MQAFTFLFSIFVLVGCSASSKLEGGASPDYSNPMNWASLPTKEDKADRTPVRLLKDQQENARVDVFFVHPTTYYGSNWNASLSNKSVNRATDNGSIKHQASVFNGSCRIYAPRYRQATIRTFTKDPTWKGKALAMAYTDVRNAFLYYMEHYNKGRPVVIASHSQGTRHAYKLLQEVGKDPKFVDQLVTAYLVGWSVPYQTIGLVPPCDSATQLGCFNTWNTFIYGAKATRGKLYETSCCTNPLNWKTDGSGSVMDDHLGSVPISFDRIDTKMLDAKCIKGVLWVHSPARTGYVSLGKNFHLMDYNLFYLNIRRNVYDRIMRYEKEHGSE